jgi:hypothetical protein
VNEDRSDDEVPECGDGSSDADEATEDDGDATETRRDAAAMAMDVAEGEGESSEPCAACGQLGDDAHAVLCDGCDAPFHVYCLSPPLATVPDGDWFCDECAAATAVAAADAASLLAAHADVDAVGPALALDGWQLLDAPSGSAADPGARAADGWHVADEAAADAGAAAAPAGQQAGRAGRAGKARGVAGTEKAGAKAGAKDGARHLWSRTRRFFSWRGRAAPADGRVVAYLPPSTADGDDALWKNRLDCDGTLEDLDVAELAKAQRRFKAAKGIRAQTLPSGAPFDDDDGAGPGGGGFTGAAAEAAGSGAGRKRGRGAGDGEEMSDDATREPAGDKGDSAASHAAVVEEIVWAQAGPHDPFWPAFIAEPSAEQRRATPLPKHCRYCWLGNALGVWSEHGIFVLSSKRIVNVLCYF